MNEGTQECVLYRLSLKISDSRIDGAHFPSAPTYPPLGARSVPTGPGAANYQAKLQGMELAFKTFFARLAAAGIDQTNTLFLFYPEEEDKFNGVEPTPAGCDGVNTVCNYSTPIGATSPFGTTSVNLPFLYFVDNDSLVVMINSNPGPTAALTRQAERFFATLQYPNFYTGLSNIVVPVLADDQLQRMLHIVTADPYRLPTFMTFSDQNYNVSSLGFFVLTVPTDNRYTWLHGTISPEITKAWFGIAGPGVRDDSGKGGLRGDLWSDHTDVRPTLLALLGLKDTYQHQGRALIEVLNSGAVSKSLVAHRNTLICLGQVYKQVNAPMGRLSQAALKSNTVALASGSIADDSVYLASRATMASILTRRNVLVADMEAALSNAAFNNTAIKEQNAQDLIKQGNDLITEVETLAGVTGGQVICRGN